MRDCFRRNEGEGHDATEEILIGSYTQISRGRAQKRIVRHEIGYMLTGMGVVVSHVPLSSKRREPFRDFGFSRPFMLGGGRTARSIARNSSDRFAAMTSAGSRRGAGRCIIRSGQGLAHGKGATAVLAKRSRANRWSSPRARPWRATSHLDNAAPKAPATLSGDEAPPGPPRTEKTFARLAIAT